MRDLKVWRCRWCGRRIFGVRGWFHKPKWCAMKPPKGEPSSQLEVDTDHWCNDTGIA